MAEAQPKPFVPNALSRRLHSLQAKRLIAVSESERKKELKLLRMYPETFIETHVVCDDGFSQLTTVNKENKGIPNLAVSGLIQIMHELYHFVYPRENCKGLTYSF